MLNFAIVFSYPGINHFCTAPYVASTTVFTLYFAELVIFYKTELSEVYVCMRPDQFPDISGSAFAQSSDKAVLHCSYAGNFRIKSGIRSQPELPN